MSLNWSVEKVKGFDEWGWVKDSSGEEVMNPVTDRIIWATLSVDMGEITEKNADEFFLRLQVLERNFRVKYGLTLEDVHRHIGLKVNVCTETRKGWLRKQMKHLEQDMEQMARDLKKDESRREGVA